MFWLLLIVLVGVWDVSSSQVAELPSSIDYNTSTVIYGLYGIEGKVMHPEKPMPPKDFLVNTKVIINYGQYFGFLKSDGTFVVSNLPPGSYVVEISNANFFYEPARVDINSKGKLRARKVNYMNIGEVKQLVYPLKFKAKAPLKYFQVRETWRVTDFLFNPMIIMMVLPFLLLIVLPKLVNTNDAETQKELQNLPKMDMSELPEISQMFTNMFGGGGKPPASQAKIKAGKKRQ